LFSLQKYRMTLGLVTPVSSGFVFIFTPIYVQTLCSGLHFIVSGGLSLPWSSGSVILFHCSESFALSQYYKLIYSNHAPLVLVAMSKISFTVSVPHKGPRIPQFSISCNNATYLSFKGKAVRSARWGNGNTAPKKGWKRVEFGVTGSSTATRLSLMLNTSVILPPLAWSTPGPAPAASTTQGGSSATENDCAFPLSILGEWEGG
jgi:hypothetical protein